MVIPNSKEEIKSLSDWLVNVHKKLPTNTNCKGRVGFWAGYTSSKKNDRLFFHYLDRETKIPNDIWAATEPNNVKPPEICTAVENVQLVLSNDNDCGLRDYPCAAHCSFAVVCQFIPNGGNSI